MNEPKTEITLREVYDAQQQMLATLNEMRSVIDKVSDHENRIRKLEFRQVLWAGGLALLAIFAPPVLSIVVINLMGV